MQGNSCSSMQQIDSGHAEPCTEVDGSHGSPLPTSNHVSLPPLHCGKDMGSFSGRWPDFNSDTHMPARQIRPRFPTNG
jgi:hypothetical protein